MSLAQDFKTDGSLEKKGIIIDYGHTQVRIARAGGANKKFAKVLEKLTKPYRRSIQAGTMDNDRSTELLQLAYARAVILDWKSSTGEKDGKHVLAAGIDPEAAGEKGKALLPFDEESIMKVFKNLPDFFIDLQEQATRVELFRMELDTADSKN